MHSVALLESEASVDEGAAPQDAFRSSRCTAWAASRRLVLLPSLKAPVAIPSFLLECFGFLPFVPFV